MIIYTQVTSDNALLLQLNGRLDVEAGLAFKQKLQEVGGSQYDFWVVDLSRVDFLDSAGIGALIKGLDLAKTYQRRFILKNPHPSVKMVLEIARLDELFEIFEEPVVLPVATNGSVGTVASFPQAA